MKRYKLFHKVMETDGTIKHRKVLVDMADVIPTRLENGVFVPSKGYDLGITRIKKVPITSLMHCSRIFIKRLPHPILPDALEDRILILKRQRKDICNKYTVQARMRNPKDVPLQSNALIGKLIA